MCDFHLDGGGTHQLRLSCSSQSPQEITEGVARLADFITAQTTGTAG
jgi:(S)-3,5-dihydroxyphenylglycine transaminase